MFEAPKCLVGTGEGRGEPFLVFGAGLCLVDLLHTISVTFPRPDGPTPHDMGAISDNCCTSEYENTAWTSLWNVVSSTSIIAISAQLLRHCAWGCPRLTGGLFVGTPIKDQRCERNGLGGLGGMSKTRLP